MKQFLALAAILGLTAAAPPSPYQDGYISRESGTIPSEVNVVKAAAAAVSAASAASATASIDPSVAGTHESGGEEYVVLFDADQPEPPEVEAILNRLALTSNHSDVKYAFNNSAFRGFVASMQSHCIELLNNMTEVSHVEKTVNITSLKVDTATEAPWGLQRISSGSAVDGSEREMDFTYSFEDESLGAGVDIYVVDTGVNVDHVAFSGRASTGFSFETDTSDGDGHGTHVAGTAAGDYFGVARKANIYSVKVLGADGSGKSSDTIAGMNWVIQNHEQRQNASDFVGSVMSMSWGLGGVSDSINKVIELAVAQGIHVAVAAGNSGNDSCNYSPSSAGGSQGPAVSVGAIGIDDAISSFSNTGACNDVYAPGESVLSAWKDSPTTVNFLSGTSMACPHVTGIMAYLMAKDAALRDPAAMKTYLAANGLANAIAGDVLSGDAAVLANNGVTSVLTRARRWVDVHASGRTWTPVGVKTDDDNSAKRSLLGWARDLLGRRESAATTAPTFVLKSREPQLRY